MEQLTKEQTIAGPGEMVIFQHDVGIFNNDPSVLQPHVERAARLQSEKPYDRRIVTFKYPIPTPEKTLSIVVLERVDVRDLTIAKFGNLLQRLVKLLNCVVTEDELKIYTDELKNMGEEAEQALADEALGQMLSEPDSEAED